MQQAVQNTPSPLERNITVSVPIAQLEAEIAAAGDARLDARFARAARSLRDPTTAEVQARATLESLALCVQGSLMKRHADAAAAEAFCASRLGDGSRVFGGLELGTAALAALALRARLTPLA